MRTRIRKFKSGNYVGITKVQSVEPNDVDKHTNYLIAMEYSETNGVKNNASDVCQFIPRSHGGVGLTIEINLYNKGGRCTQGFIELGKGDVEMLIDYLSKYVSTLGEYNCDEQTDTKKK